MLGRCTKVQKEYEEAKEKFEKMSHDERLIKAVEIENSRYDYGPMFNVCVSSFGILDEMILRYAFIKYQRSFRLSDVW